MCIRDREEVPQAEGDEYNALGDAMGEIDEDGGGDQGEDSFIQEGDEGGGGDQGEDYDDQGEDYEGGEEEVPKEHDAIMDPGLQLVPDPDALDRNEKHYSYEHE
eukprot:5672900-Pyramimonas_sp.AAC.1